MTASRQMARSARKLCQVDEGAAFSQQDNDDSAVWLYKPLNQRKNSMTILRVQRMISVLVDSTIVEAQTGSQHVLQSSVGVIVMSKGKARRRTMRTLLIISAATAMLCEGKRSTAKQLLTRKQISNVSARRHPSRRSLPRKSPLRCEVLLSPIRLVRIAPIQTLKAMQPLQHSRLRLLAHGCPPPRLLWSTPTQCRHPSQLLAASQQPQHPPLPQPVSQMSLLARRRLTCTPTRPDTSGTRKKKMNCSRWSILISPWDTKSTGRPLP